MSERTYAALGEIADERERQKAVEGWAEAHDDEHTDQSLARAAACYANPRIAPDMWPASWHLAWWKPKDHRRNLVRAGALIVAEIERLDRREIEREIDYMGGVHE
jgi:hypothetical protein